MEPYRIKFKSSAAKEFRKSDRCFEIPPQTQCDRLRLRNLVSLRVSIVLT
ncbi:hypothetical protein VB834_13025 [Limnoraphis robusta Tam1]|uniref:Uncharacterized protein n=1 Tax=Limnoraphis robusta CCNP1315 TaxID=3110306 RepID=A0ABU5TWY4_9CYAN|nr:hypothetical protein [Limnoraphis robusta]MEA5501103.1 hypothetical protein [Limnoraphis robusta BA-68 BA1]MEA5519414.1 hypothetical protein [Limnoraphis robusta CCNP1315]MEA5539953.1 hypothetical protein [Limnoraphis robusta Tam1]MEA5549130.1 hypothetical protein [Limnoraphis robusta CCNP1324]